MAKCNRCGAYCADHYTYCRKCYYELGQPFGKATERVHKCRGCGANLRGRYSYCENCSRKKGFIDNNGFRGCYKGR